jgi:hypothetical protein
VRDEQEDMRVLAEENAALKKQLQQLQERFQRDACKEVCSACRFFITCASVTHSA